jgi:DNA invertase Pin-like site-specific DNA recombinase
MIPGALPAPRPNEIAVLIRQSTRKAQQRESNPKQVDFLTHWCGELGWEFPSDPLCRYEAIASGVSDIRPELDRLFEDLKSGLRTVVMVYHPSRVARLPVISYELIEAMREARARFAVRSEEKIYDFAQDADTLSQDAQGLADEGQWQAISIAVRDGMMRKARAGLWPTAAPFGLKRIGRGILVPHEQEAIKLNEQIRALSSLSLGQMRELDPSTPRSTLHYRSKNMAYEKLLSFGRTRIDFVQDPNARYGDRPRRTRVVIPANQVITVAGAISSPVDHTSLALARKNQAARRYNRGGWGTRRQRDPFVFSVLAKCGICHSRMSRKMTRKPHSGKLYQYVGCWTSGCANRGATRDDWENSVLSGLTEMADDRESAVGALRQRIEAELALAAPGLEAATAKLIALERRRLAIESGLKGRLVFDPEVQEVYRSTLIEIQTLEAENHRASELRRLLSSPEAATPLLAAIRDLLDQWGVLSPLTRMALLRKSFDSVIFHSSRNIEFPPNIAYLS